MRPALAASSVRSDTVVAFQDASRTSVTFLSASLKLLPDLALSARYGWVHDAPDAGAARSAFTNVGLAVLYAPKLDAAFRVPLSGGVVLPVAQGGGGAPDPDAQKAIASAGYARASMDNAMFGPNDLSLFVGLGLAYVKDGWTFQAEATIFYLARTKGGAAQRDEVKANTTWAAHAGYYLLPQLSIGAELRYQDFIAPPKAIQRTPQRRDAATAAIGLRWHLAIGQHALHPGVSYAHPLDDPMAKAGYRIVQLDVPFVF